ncbi:MaoC family dehydratase [Ktedonosporobacter rubrisoli]|uniref:MaoC family dehydratase n=1 Tax=Ktedonosporobacter rubrisoli TaxID=2509675 RepID=A0A4P6JZK9_KTERU|nr:MaoC family dehydratase N-terminal domain-containing protein [Ktedonosporobacter rubrisoli]QBD80556.1 MaoC family dehydratase [Ktedonosporobacter rubrisoli]
MFDKSKVGTSFPPFKIEVERCKIHEFNLAIGDPNPIYHSREAALAAEYRDVPLSPTAATIFNFWGNTQAAEQFASVGINVKRILHGDEEYEYQAPIYPGDVLTGVMRIVEGKHRQMKDGSSLDVLTTEIQYTNQQEQPVLKARTTIAVRE